MKILLVAPSSGVWNGIGKRKIFDGRTFRFSLLPLLTVAALTPGRHDITLVDEQVEDIPQDQDFDMVGITVMTATSSRAYEISAAFRKKGVPVVLGGFHPSLNQDEALGHADAIVIGPAYKAWPEAVADAEAGRLKKRYYGIFDGKTRIRLPRNLMKPGKYITPNATCATLGCTNTCSFCSISAFYGAKRHYRGIGDVADEIAGFKDRFFMLLDDNLTQDRDYAIRLFKAIAPLEKKWVTQASIEIADDPGLLEAMAGAGCIGVFAGLESFSMAALASQNKNIKPPEKYREAVRKLHAHGMYVEAGVMLGFDVDTCDTFRDTLHMLDEAGIDVIQASIVTPLPGTRYFKDMEHRITDRNWEHYGFKHAVFTPAHMTQDELEAGSHWLIREFYSLFRIIRRIPGWLAVKDGYRNFWYPLLLNLAYFERTISFKLKGHDPAGKRKGLAGRLKGIFVRA